MSPSKVVLHSREASNHIIGILVVLSIAYFSIGQQFSLLCREVVTSTSDRGRHYCEVRKQGVFTIVRGEFFADKFRGSKLTTADDPTSAVPWGGGEVHAAADRSTIFTFKIYVEEDNLHRGKYNDQAGESDTEITAIDFYQFSPRPPPG